MISFSTSWADGDISNLLGILPHIDSVEVGSRGSAEFFERIEGLALDNALTVRSVHASAGPHKRMHDPSYTKYFASCDSEKREKNIDDVLRTAEWAEKIGAENIVLHAGTVADETVR
jgi:sugar phosphate isomerase/epimerase